MMKHISICSKVKKRNQTYNKHGLKKLHLRVVSSRIGCASRWTNGFKSQIPWILLFIRGFREERLPKPNLEVSFFDPKFTRFLPDVVSTGDTCFLGVPDLHIFNSWYYTKLFNSNRMRLVRFVFLVYHS